MKNKRIKESARIVADADGSFRVCLISEGQGSSALFLPEFFTQENADALAGSLSFPGHPRDGMPEYRDPMSAIGSIADEVTVETDPETNLVGFWSRFIPSESEPRVAKYIKEFGPKLGLSVFIDSTGHEDPETYRWIPRTFDGSDPYKSVDLVVAAGRGGKFEKVAESLGLIAKTSATAGEKKENPMTPEEMAVKIDGISKTVEGLAKTVSEGKTADAQVKADADAVAKTVEARFDAYDKAVTLITEAKLTESQSAELRTLAKSGADIAPHIENAKKVLAEARAAVESEDETTRKTTEFHFGDQSNDSKSPVDFRVAGFGGM